jgi:hypothetical protein
LFSGLIVAVLGRYHIDIIACSCRVSRLTNAARYICSPLFRSPNFFLCKWKSSRFIICGARWPSLYMLPIPWKAHNFGTSDDRPLIGCSSFDFQIVVICHVAIY